VCLPPSASHFVREYCFSWFQFSCSDPPCPPLILTAFDGLFLVERSNCPFQAFVRPHHARCLRLTGLPVPGDFFFIFSAFQKVLPLSPSSALGSYQFARPVHVFFPTSSSGKPFRACLIFFNRALFSPLRYPDPHITMKNLIRVAPVFLPFSPPHPSFLSSPNSGKFNFFACPTP